MRRLLLGALSARGCYNLGVIYNDGAGVAVDRAAAAKLFEKARQKGSKRF